MLNIEDKTKGNYFGCSIAARRNLILEETMKTAFILLAKMDKARQRYTRQGIKDNTIYILLLLSAADMLFCIPVIGYQIVKVVSNKSWSAENKRLTEWMDFHMVSTAYMCIFAALFLWCRKLQAVVTTIIRIFSLYFIFTIKQTGMDDNFLLIMTWVVTSVGICQTMMLILHAVAGKDELQKEFGVARYVKLLIPAMLCTAFSTSVVYALVEETSFKLHYFILYVLGFETLIASSYSSMSSKIEKGKNDKERIATTHAKHDNNRFDETIIP